MFTGNFVTKPQSNLFKNVDTFYLYAVLDTTDLRFPNFSYWIDTGSQTASQSGKSLVELCGVFKNTEYFEVIDGLKEGDRVITSSYDHFGDNEVLLLK